MQRLIAVFITIYILSSNFCLHAQTATGTNNVNPAIQENSGEKISDKRQKEFPDELIEQNEAESDAETDKNTKEKMFINPWLGTPENRLQEFLEQNWFLSDYLNRTRQLNLAISATASRDREFRRDYELLSRDPGVCQYYSVFCIIPELLRTQAELLVNSFADASEKIIERKLSKDIAEKQLSDELQKSIELSADFAALSGKISQNFEKYLVTNARKTTVSRWHSLCRRQNQELIEILQEQNSTLKALVSQHIHQLKTAANQLALTSMQEDVSEITFSVRLKKIEGLIRDSLRNKKNYQNQLLFFAVRLKELVKSHYELLYDTAMKSSLNKFHLRDFLGNFPKRDFHLQKTPKFSYQTDLHTMLKNLAAQFNRLSMLQYVPRPDTANDQERFNNTLLSFDKGFTKYKNFNALFSELYKEEENQDFR
ncbi:MAG: hypothetical protein Kow0029_27960 [Candidatus Rifleibacteriota bacterium]